ncbi:putative glycosyl transferase, family 14 [Helianthus annuus]|nr:putative glycosyl transferase, family 14 [Helianthus annuus]
MVSFLHCTNSIHFSHYSTLVSCQINPFHISPKRKSYIRLQNRVHPFLSFAYLISGSKGDLNKLWRTLRALYHPWNYYVVHLDLESEPEERMELASRVEKDPMFAEVGNVYMITKAYMVTYRGPTMVSNTLHAYLLSTFRNLNRDWNFVEHTSQLGWKEDQRAMPLMIDPGLYENKKSDIFWVQPNRPLANCI